MDGDHLRMSEGVLLTPDGVEPIPVAEAQRSAGPFTITQFTAMSPVHLQPGSFFQHPSIPFGVTLCGQCGRPATETICPECQAW